MIFASLVVRRDRRDVRKDVTRVSKPKTRSALRLAALLINSLAMTGCAPVLINLWAGRASLVVVAANRSVRAGGANRRTRSNEVCVLIAEEVGLYRATRDVMAECLRRADSARTIAERMDFPNAIMGVGRVWWRGRAEYVKRQGATAQAELEMGIQVAV